MANNQTSLSVSSSTYCPRLPISNMCQTEIGVVGFKKSSDGRTDPLCTATTPGARIPIIRTFHVIRETRILTTFEEIESTFGCDDENLNHVSTDQKPGNVPVCPALDEGNFLSVETVKKVFIPWFRSAMNTLYAYYPCFKGPTRDHQMLEWLRLGSVKSKCKNMQNIFLRIGKGKERFNEKIDLIKRAVRWSREMESDLSLSDLLNWKGCQQGEDLSIAWESFLDLYHVLDKSILSSFDSQLKTLIRSFINQSPVLINSVMNASPTICFVNEHVDDNFNGEFSVISDPINAYEEASHLRLVCLTHMAISHWKSIFGRESIIIASHPFNRANPTKLAIPTEKQPLSNQMIKIGFKHRGNFSNQQRSTRPHFEPPTSVDNKDRWAVQKDQSEKRQRIKSLKSVDNNKSTDLTNLFNSYLQLSSNSQSSIIVDVAFDTGNECDNLFPARLLPYATSLKSKKLVIPCAGNENNCIVSTHYGTLSFIVPVDPHGTVQIQLDGLFMSPDDSNNDDEIIVSRHSLPTAPGLNVGLNYPIVGKLRAYPDVNIGLNERLRQTWHIDCTSKGIGFVKKIDGEAIEITGKEATQEVVDTLELNCNNNEFALCKQIHLRLGHPPLDRFEITLKAHGITFHRDIIKGVLNTCNICKHKPQPQRPISDDDSRQWKRGYLAFQDLTEPTVKGIGGYRYISIITCDTTGFIGSYNCINKTDALIHLGQFLRENPYITHIRVDGAGELNSQQAKGITLKQNVVLENCAAGAHSSMGIAERANRTVKDRITTLMMDFQLETRSELWPWFTEAAVDTLNMCASRSRESKCPVMLRHALLVENGCKKPPPSLRSDFGFGDPVYFITPRELKIKDPEHLPDGRRIGLFVSRSHTGLASILSIQKERVVLWTIHTRSLSHAPHDTGRKYRALITWALLNSDVKDVRRIFFDGEKSLKDDILPYPYNIDWSESESESKNNGNWVRVLSCDETSTINKTKKYNGKKIKSIQPLGSATLLTPCIHTMVISDGEKTFAAVSKPYKGLIDFQKLNDGLLDSNHIPMTINVTDAFKHGMKPAILSHSKQVTILPGCETKTSKLKRTSGNFHLRYGYIADDEAPPSAVDNGDFDAADMKEWLSIMENDVFGPCIQPSTNTKICRTRFRRTYKTTATGETIEKSRFLVCETNDTRDVEISTQMPHAWIRRLVVCAGLCNKWKAATIDIKTAFLLVTLPPSHGDIFIKLPSHLPSKIKDLGFEQNSVYQLKKSLYGLKEAPRLFNEFLSQKLEELGWLRIFGGVFTKPDNSAYLIAYVDDLLVLSVDPIGHLITISEKLKCSDLLPVNMTPQRHVGLEITALDNSFFFNITAYIKDLPNYTKMIDDLGGDYKLKGLSPISNLPLFDSELPSSNNNTPYEIVNLYQQIMGTLGWIALCHPAVAARHGELATYTHSLTVKAFRVTKGVLSELQQTGLSPLEFVGISTPRIRLWIDCAVHHHSGRRGWLLQIAEKDWDLTDRRNIIAWRSVKDRMKHASSTSGEVNAIQQALEDTDEHMLVLSKFFPTSTVEILSDSMSGILQIQNGGHSIKDRERASYIKYLISALPLPCLGINHVSGLIQLADPLTKIKHLHWYDKPTTNI